MASRFPRSLDTLFGGAPLRPFSRDTMRAAYKASFRVYDRIAANNANFKTFHESWKGSRVCESIFENFVCTQNALERRRG